MDFTDFGNLQLMALRIRLAEVANASKGALSLHMEDIVEGGIKVCLIVKRCGLESWSVRETQREARLRDEQLLPGTPSLLV